MVNGTPGDDTFVNVGGGVKIFGGGGRDTFVVKRALWQCHDHPLQFQSGYDDLSHTLFASVSDILANAHPADFGHTRSLPNPAHDHITLTGVTVAQLRAHASDFHLV